MIFTSFDRSHNFGDLSKIVQNILTSQHRFATSAEIVMEVSGLRLEAIKAIAREEGVIIEDARSRCIDENLLSLLADALVRRTKYYFNNVQRQMQNLSGAEIATFNDFCKTFKKHQTNNSTATKWTDIDTDAIREQFIEKVHQKTPSLFSETLARLGAALDFDNIEIEPVDTIDHKLLLQRKEISDRRSLVFDDVKNSYLFYTKPVIVHEYDDSDKRNNIRKVTLTARYHIFTKDDKDDNILNDTRNINYNINRALKDVA